MVLEFLKQSEGVGLAATQAIDRVHNHGRYLPGLDRAAQRA